MKTLERALSKVTIQNGDMDSIDKDILKNPDIENIPIADQNSTDLEKCLSQVSAEIFIGFGFLDLRLEF